MGNPSGQGIDTRDSCANVEAPFDQLVAMYQEIPDDDSALALAMQFDRGLEAARAGVLELSAGYGELQFLGCPEHWTEIPFARIIWREDAGDRDAGIEPVSGWSLADDQTGTVVAALAAAENPTIDATGHRTPTVEEVLADLAASEWVKIALRTALARDPVDAANEAEVLASVLAARADSLLEAASKSRPHTS